VTPPELTLPLRPANAPVIPGDNGGANAPRNDEPRNGRCYHPDCTLGAGHDGAHSHELDAAARPRRPGLTSRDRTRPVANILAAVEGDCTGSLAQGCTHQSFIVAIAGDAPDQVVVSYDTSAPDQLDDVPRTTDDALNGPHGQEWREAYNKDLTAKIKNGTFTLVPRPPPHVKVVKTKVAHAHKYENPSNSAAITERRARWVGLGFMQGIGDFNATYCATPPACSCRMFFALVMALRLALAQGDVTKAFTLNPIDVILHVEQMPGMKVKGDWKGATVDNTVCLLHKCLEGLKQAGNIWQETHSNWLEGLTIAKFFCKLIQSQVDPTLFVGHCSAGIIAILVWVDDILIGHSNTKLYDEFVSMYAARFPSKHHHGCTKFAGITVDHKPGRLIIHQRPHIEHAYNKFIVDKSAASKSSAVSYPAVSDRNSLLHYSKITLAGNDTERAKMRDIPYLPALATLMYTTHFTLAHLSYHTSFLGQFMHDASLAAWEAVKCLIIYAYHHRDVDVIVYGGSIHVPKAIPQNRRNDFLDTYGLHSYSDASWLLRSPAGYIVLLMNGPIDWASKLIRVICHSSAEAEIAAGCAAGKRIVFVTQILGEFMITIKQPPMLLIDNSATDDLCGKFGVTPKTAHFLRWQHYLRWLVKHRFAAIVFVGTKDQLADILTKVVDHSTFLTACRILFKSRSA